MCDDGDDDNILVSVGGVEMCVEHPCSEVVVEVVVAIVASDNEFEVKVGIRTGDDEK